MIRRTRMPRRSPSSRCVSASCAGSSWRRSTVAGSPSAAGGGDVRDGGGREETAASSGDDRSVRERRSVVRRRRTTGENNDVGGEGKHAAQVHLTALLPQPPEVEKVRQDASTNKRSFVGYHGGKPVCILESSARPFESLHQVQIIPRGSCFFFLWGFCLYLSTRF